MVHDPIIMVHTGQTLRGLCEMGHEIDGLTGAPYRPGNLACRHGQRVEEDARAMTQVCMFSAFTPAWLGGFGGRFALEHLHAGFFIAADHQTALGVVTNGVSLISNIHRGS
jgi:hypothetical protein